jgi:hypothetical protein
MQEESGKWTHLASDYNKCRILINIGTNFLVPYKSRNFWTAKNS